MTGPAGLAAAALAGFSLLAVSSCSRAVSVESMPAASYAIHVTNGTDDELTVSYDDGSGARALGLVPAGRTERFIIAAPRTTSVTLTGRAPDGARLAGPIVVVLLPDTAVNVTLR